MAAGNNRLPCDNSWNVCLLTAKYASSVDVDGSAFAFQLGNTVLTDCLDL